MIWTRHKAQLTKAQSISIPSYSKKPFKINHYPTLFIFSSFVELEHPFLVPGRNNGAVCGNRLIIPTIFMILSLLSDLPAHNILRVPNQEAKPLLISMFLPNPCSHFNYIGHSSLGFIIENVQKQTQISITIDLVKSLFPPQSHVKLYDFL